MRSDEDIRRDVEAEVDWDPDVDASDIAISVRDGVVALAGFVRSYAQKWEAERITKRVAGVRAVANDLEVRLPQGSERPDPDVARDVVAKLKAELPYSSEFMKVTVENGWVTIEGDVEWEYQRTRAETAVRRVLGIKGVTNLMEVKPRVEPVEIKGKIEEAVKRSAELIASKIQVEVSGSEVTLKGTVKSWAEKEEAERAAWRAPGVTRVNNLIVVDWA